MLLARNFCKRQLSICHLPCIQTAFKEPKQGRLFSDSSIHNRNLYEILGVSPKATQTDIKDAYYNLTLKFHPDRNEGSPEAATKFHEITEAYNILGNYYLRKRYDKGMPMPIRHGVPTPDVPHIVKYQQFFDARNLPFQPSAYAAGGGARTFDEYHSKQFAESQSTKIDDEDEKWKKLCKERKAPSLLALVALMLTIRYVVKDIDGLYFGPRVEVEHFINYPIKWKYAEGKAPNL